MNFHIIIPARFASTRLPGKMLLEVAGKPLIQHTYERALQCGAASITIAVDDERVQKALEAVGASVCMTSIEHPNGTERLSEVVQKLNMKDDAVIVNIQGDEPLIQPSAVRLAAKALLDNKEAHIATLCTPIEAEEDIFNPNICKIVIDKKGYALYFSRAPIPWDRTTFDHSLPRKDSPFRNAWYRHIGLYAYRAKTLKEYSTLEPAPLENIEMLEQLRVLWHGGKIHASVVSDPLPPGIDTEMDLARFREQSIKKVDFF